MCCRSRSEYSTSVRGLVLGCGASFSTCGELHDNRIGHQSNALGYVLRVLLPVLEYWICGQMLAKESSLHTSIGDSCARHQCLCTGAEDLMDLIVWL